jgi:hypothetical protein
MIHIPFFLAALCFALAAMVGLEWITGGPLKWPWLIALGLLASLFCGWLPLWKRPSPP